MLLAPDSHARLEEFFRHHLRDETLRLPVVHVHAGGFSKRLTRILNIQAITFSRTIFIAPRLLRSDEGDILLAPAHLVVHEAAHVLQYRRVGLVQFLFRYLWEYVRALIGCDGRGAKSHAASYRAISFEAQARAAEDAFVAWRAR
jgi:hypothetical protein